MEKAFNLFLFVGSNKEIREIGWTIYNISQSEQNVVSLMQENVENDCGCAKRLKIAGPLTYDEYFAMCRIGTHLKIFEPVFETEKASINPLCVITSIINDKPTFDVRASNNQFIYNEVTQKELGIPYMPDYLERYKTPTGFDLPKLINDDYFVATKLLYNNKRYISAAKLLFSCIDSLSFIEFGDVAENFQMWLDRYADLKPHGVTSKDLWELRNSLLHMTKLDSRKVIKGASPRIFFYVGSAEALSELNVDNRERYLNLKGFVDTTVVAIRDWITSYNQEPSKRRAFVMRYDLTVSDARFATVDNLRN